MKDIISSLVKVLCADEEFQNALSEVITETVKEVVLKQVETVIQESDFVEEAFDEVSDVIKGTVVDTIRRSLK